MEPLDPSALRPDASPKDIAEFERLARAKFALDPSDPATAGRLAEQEHRLAELARRLKRRSRRDTVR